MSGMRRIMKSIILTIALIAGLFSCYVKADNTAYFLGADGEFGTIDLNTGVFSSLGNTGQTLAGFGEINGTLYGASYETPSGTLYSVNPANGSLSAIGASSLVYSLLGSTQNGIYAIDSQFNLYSINPTTGAATLIGATGLNTLGAWNGLSSGSSTLYLTAGANLYTLNTATGVATLVGNMGGPLVGALVVDGGVLYGGENSPALQVDTINPLTGEATAGSSLTGTSASFFGLAPTSAVPEPSVASLVVIGIGFFSFFLRRKNRLAQARH
jgi:hypothetical protein